MTGLREITKPTKSNFTKSIETKKALSDALRKSAGIGVIDGPGTGTSDDVPINASDGEAVLPADTVAALGEDKVNQIIQETHTPTGKEQGLRNFADGGIIKKDEEEDIRPNLGQRTPFDPFQPAIDAQERRQAPERSTFDRAISGELGLGGTARAVSNAALDGLRSAGGAIDSAQSAFRANDSRAPTVESSAAAIEEDTALDPVPAQQPGAGGIRRIDEQGQSPLFTNLDDTQLANQQPGNFNTVPSSSPLAGSPSLTAARTAALNEGRTSDVRRSLRLEGGGVNAERQKLDDRERQLRVGAGNDPRSRRDLRFSLRRLDEQREDLATLENTQTLADADVVQSQIQAGADLASAGLRGSGSAATTTANTGDKNLASFRESILNTLPPDADGNPDVESANRLTASTRAAVSQQAQLLRDAGRDEEAATLEKEGVGSFSETQKQGLVVGNQVRDRFLDKESDLISGTRGIDSGNPADFVPVGIDPNDPSRVLLSGDGLSMDLEDLERIKPTNTLGFFPGFFSTPRRTTALLQGIR